MRTIGRYLVALTLCVFGAFAISAHAQYENGSLLGTIRDASGAPIPNADVNVVNTSTGTHHASKTDGSGNYDVPQLRVGGRSVRQANTGYVQYVNFAALQLPATQWPTGQYLAPFGNLGRNPARTPTFNELDLDVNKRFSTPIERLKIEFLSELYNVFNHTNMYLPSSALSGILRAYANGTPNPATGTPNGGGVISSTFTPRVVQFALKALF